MPAGSMHISVPLRGSTRIRRQSEAPAPCMAQVPAIAQAVPRSPALRSASNACASEASADSGVAGWAAVESVVLTRDPPASCGGAPVRPRLGAVAALVDEHAARHALAMRLQLLRDVGELREMRDRHAIGADERDRQAHERETLEHMAAV